MRRKLRLILQSLLREEQGAASIEYALLATLIAVVIAISVGVLGQQVCGTVTHKAANPAGNPPSSACSKNLKFH